MNNKKNIMVVFGGPSNEYEVSCYSAAALINTIDKEQYNIICVGITQNGTWLQTEMNYKDIENGKWTKNKSNKRIILSNESKLKGFYTLDDHLHTFQFVPIDIIFPVIHGKIGEDGIIQGLAELAGIPLVSTDLLSSVVCFDKCQTSRFINSLGIKIPKNIIISKYCSELDFVKKELKKADIKYPLFIKPSRSGSSIGITLVEDESGLTAALSCAFKYDANIIIEEQIKGSELKIGVCGNKDDLILSEISQVFIPGNGFEDYESKYKKHNATRFLPAKIADDVRNEIIETTKKIYLALNFKVYARFDYFLTMDNQLYFNEINTIPGLTEHSSFPEIFNTSGISYTNLIQRMIDLTEEK